MQFCKLGHVLEACQQGDSLANGKRLSDGEYLRSLPIVFWIVISLSFSGNLTLRIAQVSQASWTEKHQQQI